MTDKALISGVYDTKVGALPESTCMSLHTEAGLGAIADAGLRVDEIDGLLTGYSFTSPQLMLGSVFAEYVGMHPKVSASISMGGVTGGLLALAAFGAGAWSLDARHGHVQHLHRARPGCPLIMRASSPLHTVTPAHQPIGVGPSWLWAVARTDGNSTRTVFTCHRARCDSLP